MKTCDRRALITQAVAWPWLLQGLGVRAQAARRHPVTLSVVGPGHLLLPITLASRLGADEAEGLKFRINFVGGGPMAYRDMLIGVNCYIPGGRARTSSRAMGVSPRSSSTRWSASCGPARTRRGAGLFGCAT